MQFENKIPLTIETAKKIQNREERAFACATVSKGLEVYHEPDLIHGPKRDTLPDFFVINTQNVCTDGNWIEVSRGGLKNKRDQRRVARDVGLPVVKVNGDFVEREPNQGGSIQYFQIVGATMARLVNH